RLPVRPGPAGDAAHRLGDPRRDRLVPRASRLRAAPAPAVLRRSRGRLRDLRPHALLPAPRRSAHRLRQVAAQVPSRAPLPDAGRPVWHHLSLVGLRLPDLSARPVPGPLRVGAGVRNPLRLVLAVPLLAACTTASAPVRLRSEDPASDRETEAAARCADKSCRPPLAAFYPGLGHLSCGRPSEGKALVSAGTVELAGALAGAIGRGPGSAAAQLPLLAFSDLLVASTFDLILDSQRAERLVYTPSEGLPELFGAPFDPRVLRDPLVWGGIAGSLAAGLLVSRVVDGPIRTDGLGQEPIIFGARMHDAAGYPLAGALGTALFVQVAAAEEMAFRGVLQSGWARSSGETAGWAYASI